MNMISCFLSLLTHSTAIPWKSVPQTLTKEEELRTFLNELKTQGEKWNALKLVVLGHGEVGKTTLIHAVRRSLDIRTRVSGLQPLPSPPLLYATPPLSSPLLPAPPLPSPPLPSPPLPSPLLPKMLACLMEKFLLSFTKTDHQVVDNIKAPIKTVGCNRTVGVDLSTMKLAHGDVSVWDFGGQLEYAVTHQFLLSVEVIQKTIISSSHLLDWSYIVWNRWWSTSCVMICRLPKRCRSSNAHTGSTSCSPPSQHPTRADRSGECSWWERRAKRPLCQGILRIPCHHGNRNGPTSHSTTSTSWCHHSRTKEWKHWLKAWSMSAPASSSNTPSSFHEPTSIFFSPSRPSREDKCIIPLAELKAVHWLGDPGQFNIAVKYLHAIGHIVALGDGLVCTCPQIIPKITAEFISPLEVRNRLLKNYDVQILDEEQIGVVLNIGKETAGYAHHPHSPIRS